MSGLKCPSYVVAEMHVLERDLGNAFVSAVDCLIKSVCLIVYAKYAASARNELAVLKRSTCLEYELAAGVDACDLVAFRIALRLSAGSHYDYAGALILPLEVYLVECAVDACINDIEKAVLEEREHCLCLGVAETRVVLYYLRTFRCEHESEIYNTLERSSLCLESFYRRCDDLILDPCLKFVRHVGTGCNSAHAAGVEAFVVIVSSLVVS